MALLDQVHQGCVGAVSEVIDRSASNDVVDERGRNGSAGSGKSRLCGSRESHRIESR